MNPTLRGFILIAAFSALIVAIDAESAIVQAGLVLNIAFGIVLAIVVYRIWRGHRHEIGMWPRRAQFAFYAAPALIVADLAAFWYARPSGFAALAFFLVLGICAFSMFRVWRDQHTYS
jgi:hypothetical protein